MTVALSQELRPLRARRLAMLLSMLIAVGATSLAGPLTSARASFDVYFSNFLSPGQQNAGPTYPSIARSYAATFAGGYGWVATAAHVPGGWTLCGSYVTGYNSACHSYAAGNPLGGMVSNAELYADVPIYGAVDTTVSC